MEDGAISTVFKNITFILVSRKWEIIWRRGHKFRCTLHVASQNNYLQMLNIASVRMRKSKYP